MSSLLRSTGRLLLPLRRYSSSAAASEAPFDQRKLPADYDPATFDPAQPHTPPSDRVWRLVDEVSSLTLLEVAQLSALLTRKLSITDPPLVVLMGSGPGGPAFGSANAGASAAPDEKKAEKTVFELRLESYEAPSKIKVIKEVRGFTDLGLKEAKEMVEKAPVVIKGGFSKEEAEKIIEKMKAIGAKVVME